MPRIALQDPLMQVAHQLTRLDTEFVPEGAMKTLVRRQRSFKSRARKQRP